MPKCSFCGVKIPPARGKTFVKSDGRILYFDSSKCEKSFKMGRQGVNFKWTPVARKAKGK